MPPNNEITVAVLCFVAICLAIGAIYQHVQSYRKAREARKGGDVTSPYRTLMGQVALRRSQRASNLLLIAIILVGVALYIAAHNH